MIKSRKVLADEFIMNYINDAPYQTLNIRDDTFKLAFSEYTGYKIKPNGECPALGNCLARAFDARKLSRVSAGISRYPNGTPWSVWIYFLEGKSFNGRKMVYCKTTESCHYPEY